jgi:hypothetical protein
MFAVCRAHGTFSAWSATPRGPAADNKAYASRATAPENTVYLDEVKEDDKQITTVRTIRVCPRTEVQVLLHVELPSQI